MKTSARISAKWFPLAAFTIALSLSGAFQVQAATPGACALLQTQMGTLSTKELADAFEECRVDQELCEATIEIMETTGRRGLTRSGTISRGA